MRIHHAFNLHNDGRYFEWERFSFVTKLSILSPRRQDDLMNSMSTCNLRRQSTGCFSLLRWRFSHAEMYVINDYSAKRRRSHRFALCVSRWWNLILLSLADPRTFGWTYERYQKAIKISKDIWSVDWSEKKLFWFKRINMDRKLLNEE